MKGLLKSLCRMRGYCNGAINFCEDIDEYMSLREDIKVQTDRFFLAMNANADSTDVF